MLSLAAPDMRRSTYHRFSPLESLQVKLAEAYLTGLRRATEPCETRRLWQALLAPTSLAMSLQLKGDPARPRLSGVLGSAPTIVADGEFHVEVDRAWQGRPDPLVKKIRLGLEQSPVWLSEVA